MSDGEQLLTEYTGSGSEAAFRELVERYLNLVYSAALRLVDGDTHLAQDVSQTVFADLARMAGGLSSEVSLGGWLHRHTCFVAAKTMRAERRRQSRERHAVEMNALQDDSNVRRIGPVLDEVINRLGAADRAAIMLRFFEQRDFRSVGDALGSNEEAARKRVARALDKLQVLLRRRGIAFSVAALGTTLGNQTLVAAPAGLASTVSAAALASAGTNVGALILFNVMTITKFKAGMIGAAIIVGAATPLILQHQSAAQLREQNQSLRQRVDQLTLAAENVHSQPSAELALVSNSPPEQSAELLRLRAEVARLREEARESAKLKSTVATPSESNDASFEATLKTWAARATRLKEWAEQMPDKAIPEFQFLTDKDWLDAVRGSEKMETEAEARKALSQLRGRAKSNFGSMMQKALRAYADANGGQLPTEITQLQPYFEQPVDNSTLQRYQLLQSGNVADVGKANLIAEVAAPVDQEFDTYNEFGLKSHTSKTVNKSAEALEAAVKNYARLNNGVLPRDPAQLAPYLPEAVDSERVQKFLGKIPPHITTLEQAEKAFGKVSQGDVSQNVSERKGP